MLRERRRLDETILWFPQAEAETKALKRGRWERDHLINNWPERVRTPPVFCPSFRVSLEDLQLDSAESEATNELQTVLIESFLTKALTRLVNEKNISDAPRHTAPAVRKAAVRILNLNIVPLSRSANKLPSASKKRSAQNSETPPVVLLRPAALLRASPGSRIGPSESADTRNNASGGALAHLLELLLLKLWLPRAR